MKLTHEESRKLNEVLKRLFEQNEPRSSMMGSTGLSLTAIDARLSRMGLVRFHPVRRQGAPKFVAPRATESHPACTWVSSAGVQCLKPCGGMYRKLCSMHESRQRHGQLMDAPCRTPNGGNAGSCSVPSCRVQASWAGLCYLHGKWKKAGEKNWDRPFTSRRTNVARIGGLILKVHVLNYVKAEARRRGISVHAQLVEAVESWYQERLTIEENNK